MSLTDVPALAPGSGGLSVRRQGWARLGMFSLLVVLALVLVTVVSRAIPGRPPLPFDQRLLTQLKRQRPQFVLLGNSMVGTRFDEPLLRRLLRPRRVSVMGINGAKSAVWYLRIKNLLVASGYRPRVLFFFRNDELTDPRKYTTGFHARFMIQTLSVGTESLLEQKLAPPLAKPIERLAWYREREIPLDRLHKKAEPMLDGVAEFFSGLASREPDPEVRRAQLNDLFKLGNLRPEPEARVDSSTASETPRFADVLGASFLPEICALAKEHRIPFTFVRVRTRAAASGEVNSPSEQKYDKDVEAYLRGTCGAEFYDMSNEAWESIDLYGSGDHIADKFRRRYTEMFVEHMGHLFH